MRTDGFRNGTKPEIILRKERIPCVDSKVYCQRLGPLLPFPGKKDPFVPHEGKKKKTDNHEQKDGKGD
jgi:hypothetical protein